MCVYVLFFLFFFLDFVILGYGCGVDLFFHFLCVLKFYFYFLLTLCLVGEKIWRKVKGSFLTCLFSEKITLSTQVLILQDLVVFFYSFFFLYFWWNEETERRRGSLNLHLFCFSFAFSLTKQSMADSTLFFFFICLLISFYFFCPAKLGFT